MRNLIEVIKNKGDYKSNVTAKAALVAVTESIKELVAKGEDVSIIGFGSFKVSTRAAKSGKIPGTDKTYTSEPKQVVKFKVGSKLAQAAEGK